MSQLVGFPADNGTVAVVGLGSLFGVPDDIEQNPGPPVPPEWLDDLAGEKVTYADDHD